MKNRVQYLIIASLLIAAASGNHPLPRPVPFYSYPAVQWACCQGVAPQRPTYLNEYLEYYLDEVTK